MSAFNRNEVCSEDILLGLLSEDRSGAARILESFGLTKDLVARRTRKSERLILEEITFTVEAKKLLDEATHQASTLNHPEVTPEHILLALIHHKENVVSRVLGDDSDANLETMRVEVLQELSLVFPDPSQGPSDQELARAADLLYQQLFGRLANRAHENPDFATAAASYSQCRQALVRADLL